MRDQARTLPAGFEVTSTWLDELEEGKETHEQIAERDIADIVASDYLILFTVPPEQAMFRGGRHFESGYIAGRFGFSRVLIVGPRENVFHSLCPRFDTLQQAVEYLQEKYGHKKSEGNRDAITGSV